MDEFLDDGTLRFVPSQLNRQPVVMGGLTADEMFATIGACTLVGLVLGAVVAIFTGYWAAIIFGALLVAVIGLPVTSRILGRMKRGRPDTWVYRRVQLLLVLRGLGSGLILRTGTWSCQRTQLRGRR